MHLPEDIMFLVIKMKKFLIVIISAIIIGSIFSIYIYKGIDTSFAITKLDKDVTLFQAGVYKSLENAVLLSKKYDSSVIINDDDLFRVYIGIARDKEVIQAYKNYYDLNNINYYEKKEKLKTKCINEIEKYERMIKTSFNSETYNNINKILLNYYKDECHD